MSYTNHPKIIQVGPVRNRIPRPQPREFTES